MVLQDANQRHGHGHVHAEVRQPPSETISQSHALFRADFIRCRDPQEWLPVPGGDLAAAKKDGEARLFVDLEPVPTISKRHDVGDDRAAPCGRTMSQSFKEGPRLANSLPLSGPVQLAASTGFAWAKKPRPDAMAAAKTSSSKCPRTKNDDEVEQAVLEYIPSSLGSDLHKHQQFLFKQNDTAVGSWVNKFEIT
jgi:hypothetical protein